MHLLFNSIFNVCIDISNIKKFTYFSELMSTKNSQVEGFLSNNMRFYLFIFQTCVLTKLFYTYKVI